MSPAEDSTIRREAPGNTVGNAPLCLPAAKAPTSDKLGSPSLQAPAAAGRCCSERSNWAQAVAGTPSAVPVAVGSLSMPAVGSCRTALAVDRPRMSQVVVGMPPSAAAAEASREAAGRQMRKPPAAATEGTHRSVARRSLAALELMDTLRSPEARSKSSDFYPAPPAGRAAAAAEARRRRR